MPTESGVNRILVVDSDRETAAMLRTLLEARGFVVRIAFDGLSALAAIQADTFSLFIVATALPTISAEDLVERLDQDERTHGIPVMAIAPKNDYQQRVRMFELGIDDYLAKPLSPLDVLGRVQNLTRRPSVAAAEQRGETIVFIGCAGGVGTTTLCTNMAQALGARADTVLIDAAWPLGGVSLALDAPPEDGLQQLAAARLSPESAASYLVGARAGIRFRYLNGFDALGQPSEAMPDVGAILKTVAESVRFVLVDAGTAGSPFAADCLREADFVVLVMAFERTHVALTKGYLEYLDRLGIRHSRRLIIGNRLRPSPLGVRDVARSFEDQVTLIIPYEAERLSRCLNDGLLLITQYPDSAGAIALVELATTLTRQTSVQA
ncbi:MAG: response regulator [Anaerolineae bacterium]